MKNATFAILSIAILSASCGTSKKTANANNMNLTGTWELDIIPYTAGTIDQLYPQHKPTITFNETEASYSANTGCNTARGKLVKEDNKINFTGAMMMTKMACPGDGEKIFIDNLKKVNQYSISADGKTLSFIQGDIALMRFHKSMQ